MSASDIETKKKDADYREQKKRDDLRELNRLKSKYPESEGQTAEEPKR